MTQEALVGLLLRIVSGGASPREAARELVSGGMESQAVQEALFTFLERAGLVRTAGIPGGLVGQLYEPWYLGPAPTHKFWPALELVLRDKGWKPETIKSIDDASTKILSLLPPPRTHEFCAKGLVLGYIQSGKTANFSAVIAKAADVGYRFVIVMSGITNSLRKQTQDRLNRELVELNPQLWIPLTEAQQDFRTPIQRASALLSSQRPDVRNLVVVKKNATVLRKLVRWLAGAGTAILNEYPLLVIDDEADQASVNAAATREERTAINELVLQLLRVSPRCSYLAYTATPFANLLIDATLEDLYPRDFIVDLEPPPNYFGTERLFGRARLPQDEAEPVDGLDMIRIVDEPDVQRFTAPSGDAIAGWAPRIEGSLAEALDYFLLATASRWARGQKDRFSTMLVHTSQRVGVQKRFEKPVRDYLKARTRELAAKDEEWLLRLRDQWDRECAALPGEIFARANVTFTALLPFLPSVLEATQVVVENSQSRLRLDYTEEARPCIVIGGNVLSRGLTLEGLIVSYFLRSATAYDALLQMGRWFGYRDDYEELPRVWLSAELRDLFYDLATVEQEIRLDIQRFELERLTPLEFAVRIRTHPKLEITSRLKMLGAVPIRMSFSGRVEQTIRFQARDVSWLRQNQAAVRVLIRAVEVDDRLTPTRGAADRHVLYSDVSADRIRAFFREYQVHLRQDDFQPQQVNRYIEAQNASGELKSWDLVVVSPAGSDLGAIELGGAQPFQLVNRARFERGTDPNTADIKALLSENDIVADMGPLSHEQRDWNQAKLLEHRFGDVTVGRRGLLLVFPIGRNSYPGPRSDKRRRPLDAVEDVIGIGVVFPRSSQEVQSAVDYVTAALPTVSIESVETEELEREIESPEDDQPQLG